MEIEVQGDLVGENDETFTVTLSNPSVGTLDRATATGTISNDDGIAGTAGADTIEPGNVSAGVAGGEPSDADDEIDALGGDDLVTGGGGQDTIRGGDGADRLQGGKPRSRRYQAS